MTQPTGNHVFVKRMPSLRHNKIYFPQASDINSSDVLKFQIVSVGPGRRTKKGAVIPIEAAPGDIILWQSYTGAPLQVNGDTYCINAKDIMGVLSRSVDEGPAHTA